MTSPRIISLREYETLTLAGDELDVADAEIIFREYGEKIEIEEPTMRTGRQWRLRSLGWAGSIPLRPGLRLHLEPKVPAVSIFRMLEYAYRLKSFEILNGLSESDRIEEVYQQLASVLARRVLDRARNGLYRAYVPEEDRLPYVRGALDVTRSLRTPWDPSLHCAYQEHTPDVRENQLLAWTLDTILRQGLCTNERREHVAAARRALQGAVTLRSFRPADCLELLYHRLNNDYRPLHALCRFFLEHAGPTHERGSFATIPFLVDMARLYEKYVAEYLASKAGEGRAVEAQQEFCVSAGGEIRITIDMVLSDTATGRPLAVLDTKYKKADQPSAGDLQQIVAYAVARNCRRGVLIYPAMPARPFNGPYGAGDVEVITTCVTPEGEVGEELAAMLGIERTA